MNGGRDVYITWDDKSVHIRGHSPGETGLFVSGDGIDGWDSSPDAKVSMTEMQTGNGAFPVSEQDVLYGARTVTINFHAHGSDRSETVSLMRSISEACGHIVSVRVVDADDDTFCRGYVQPGFEAEWYQDWATGVLTVVCPDPRRYSTDRHVMQLFPTGSASGGLLYGDGGDGLVYPLNYGSSAEAMQNVGTLVNEGTSPSYPVITVTGPMDARLRIDCGDRSIVYTQPVRGVPLVIDFLSRTASVGGLDTSRNLESRGFSPVPAGGSLSLSLQSTGSGWATVEWRDTYI